MHREKIFGVGFHKTGTSSLGHALGMLGYRTVHGDGRSSRHGGDEGVGLIRRNAAGDYDLPTLSIDDAFLDNPTSRSGGNWRENSRRRNSSSPNVTRRDGCKVVSAFTLKDLDWESQLENTPSGWAHLAA